MPSHGTALFATSYAIDFVPVDDTGRTAPISLRSLIRGESPHLFPGFGRPVFAPAEGIVVAAHEAEEDHDAHRGLPSLGYAVTQRARAAQGWLGLAGNHVFIDVGRAVVALCHLRQAMQSPDVDHARAVPFTLRGALPPGGTIVDIAPI